MLYVTDLDRTMIFSRRVVQDSATRLYCIEYKNGVPISYVTFAALDKIKTIMGLIPIIPATARSIEQLNRVEFFSTTQYAIADNGGVILQNGHILEDWSRYISSIVSNHDFEEVLDVLNKSGYLSSSPRIVDNSTVVAEAIDENIPYCYLQNSLNQEKWQVLVKRTHIHVAPRAINKCLALDYICKNLITPSSPIIASGDSFFDLDMLNYADVGITPKDGYLSKTDDSLLKIGISYTANEAILDYVLDYYSQL